MRSSMLSISALICATPRLSVTARSKPTLADGVARDRSPQALSGLLRGVHVRRDVDDEEFFAAQTTEHVGGPAVGLERVGHLAQHDVTDIVAEVVVHALEVVDVADHGPRAAFRSGAQFPTPASGASSHSGGWAAQSTCPVNAAARSFRVMMPSSATCCRRERSESSTRSRSWIMRCAARTRARRIFGLKGFTT